MSSFFYNSSASSEIVQLLETLAGAGFPVGSTGEVELIFRHQPDVARLAVTRQGAVVTISYPTTALAARGIGAALAGLECDETITFTTLGIMLDCSRNKVFTVNYLKKYLAKAALAGVNLCMLYTEDTYQLPDEPFWGYMRGGYTLAELQELDAYAETLGMELCGCIQTLGHLASALQWSNAFDRVTDTPKVLLADEPATYALIEKMIRFWSQALRSRRIHIGMDETHDLGRGKFMDKHGTENPFTLFNRHLSAVNQICGRYGYNSPIIWSDMYFRLSNPDLNYYDDSRPIPAQVRAEIPANVTLCYWDYYHDNSEFYERYIRHHRELGFEPLVASGIWTWALFWSAHKQNQLLATPCIEACRKTAVKELIFTMWGDDGGFCQYDSSLADLLMCCDQAYAGSDGESTARRFEALTGDDYALSTAVSKIHDAMNFDSVDIIMAVANELWDDPLLRITHRGFLGFFPDFGERRLNVFMEVAELIRQSGMGSRSDSYQVLQHLCDFLVLKYQMIDRLDRAYRDHDQMALEELPGLIDQMVEKLRDFDLIFRKSWLQCAKPFGLEVIQKRNAMQSARLEELKRRLAEWRSGEIAVIEELDASILTPPVPHYGYHNRFSGSAIV